MTATDRPVTVPPSTWRTRTAFWRVASSALAGAVLAPLPLVPFLSSVPDLLVAEWYLAAGARFPAARPGT